MDSAKHYISRIYLFYIVFFPLLFLSVSLAVFMDEMHFQFFPHIRLSVTAGTENVGSEFDAIE
jgi:hypothetical protein